MRVHVLNGKFVREGRGDRGEQSGGGGGAIRRVLWNCKITFQGLKVNKNMFVKFISLKKRHAFNFK